MKPVMCPVDPLVKCYPAACPITTNCSAKFEIHPRLAAIKKKRELTASGGLSHDKATMPNHDVS